MLRRERPEPRRAQPTPRPFRPSAAMVGFARSGSDNYSYITLNAGGGELTNPKKEVLGSMNNGATPDGSIIIGLYVDPPNSSGQYRGYIVHDGKFHPYDCPWERGHADLGD